MFDFLFFGLQMSLELILSLFALILSFLSFVFMLITNKLAGQVADIGYMTGNEARILISHEAKTIEGNINKQIDEKIAGIDSRIEQAERDIDSLPVVDLNPIEERVKQLENRPEPKPIDMTAIHNRAEKMERRIESVESKQTYGVLDMASERTKLNEAVKGVDDRLNRLIEALRTGINSLFSSGVKGEEYKTALAIKRALKELE